MPNQTPPEQQGERVAPHDIDRMLRLVEESSANSRVAASEARAAREQAASAADMSREARDKTSDLDKMIRGDGDQVGLMTRQRLTEAQLGDVQTRVNATIGWGMGIIGTVAAALILWLLTSGRVAAAADTADASAVVPPGADAGDWANSPGGAMDRGHGLQPVD